MTFEKLLKKFNIAYKIGHVTSFVWTVGKIFDKFSLRLIFMAIGETNCC